MVKESAKRGYMTREEIEAHLSKFKTAEEKLDYLERISNRDKKGTLRASGREYRERKGLLAPETKVEIRNLILEIRPQVDEHRGDMLVEKARKYEEAGDFKHAFHTYSDAMGVYGNYITSYSEADNERLLKKIKETNNQLELMWEHAKKRGGLWGVVTATTAVIGVIIGIFFLSSNITGNVIGLNQTSSNWIGGVLFIIGLVGAFAYFRRR